MTKRTKSVRSMRAVEDRERIVTMFVGQKGDDLDRQLEATRKTGNVWSATAEEALPLPSEAMLKRRMRKLRADFTRWLKQERLTDHVQIGYELRGIMRLIVRSTPSGAEQIVRSRKWSVVRDMATASIPTPVRETPLAVDSA